MSNPVRNGDNRLDFDCLVNTIPLMRGLKAALFFIDKKDEGGAYRHVRIALDGDRATISAANPVSAFAASAPLVGEVPSGQGVVDLTPDVVRNVISIYANVDDYEAMMRVKATESTVFFQDQSGFFNGDLHRWPRYAASELAPDAPAMIHTVLGQSAAESPLLMDSDTLHRVLQAQKVLRGESRVDASDAHYRFRIGAHAAAIRVFPDGASAGEGDDIEAVMGVVTPEGQEDIRRVPAAPRGGIA